MKIRLIEHKEIELIKKCETIANQNYIENSILLGDLHLPCIKLTDIYGLFDNDKFVSFFVRFNGFPQPSIVIPFNSNQLILSQIMKFLQRTISGNLSLVTYDISEAMISRFFTVEGYTFEYCMIINKNDIPSELDSPLLKKVTKEDSELIDSFYRSINAYPWNLIQLESEFYFYIECNNQIVACGGTHFENKKSAQLGNIFVLEEYRGKQYGKLITTAITREILSKKDFASLFVFQDNIPALSLYKKLGYRIHKPVNIFFCKN